MTREEAIGQEPCGDAISKQAVDVLVDELARAISDERCCISRGRSTATIMQDILDLPPVTPQPKTGHWKQNKCDVCRASRPPLLDNYCPNCGAKMIEPQESEKTETWNGIHAQVTAPKGTFERIFNDADDI